MNATCFKGQAVSLYAQVLKSKFNGMSNSPNSITNPADKRNSKLQGKNSATHSTEEMISTTLKHKNVYTIVRRQKDKDALTPYRQ